MKIGILTFHRSHNYGSMLQAYALQRVLINAGYECETIDFSSKIQHQMYALPWEQGNLIKKVVKFVYYLNKRSGLIKKHRLFEYFLYNHIKLSPKSYSKTTDLANLNYDIIITGSDQIWNLGCSDFDWAYYIDFPFKGKKISYAASMGPIAVKQPIHRLEKEMVRLSNLLQSYDTIFVREEGTKTNVKMIAGIEPIITLDPTCLLKKDEWSNIAGNQPLINGDYIFYYTPQYREDALSCAYKLGKRIKLPVVETIYNRKSKIKPDKLFLEVGPKEFLNLVFHAKFVVGASFHLIVFSLLFNKPFWAVGGMNDSRISNLLTLLHAENRAIEPNDINESYNMDYEFINSQMDILRNESLTLLLNSIKDE